MSVNLLLEYLSSPVRWCADEETIEELLPWLKWFQRNRSGDLWDWIVRAYNHGEIYHRVPEEILALYLLDKLSGRYQSDDLDIRSIPAPQRVEYRYIPDVYQSDIRCRNLVGDYLGLSHEVYLLDIQQGVVLSEVKRARCAFSQRRARSLLNRQDVTLYGRRVIILETLPYSGIVTSMLIRYEIAQIVGVDWDALSRRHHHQLYELPRPYDAATAALRVLSLLSETEGY